MNELVKLVRELFKRLAVESPDVYKKVQWWVGTFTTILTIVLAANAGFDWGWGLIIVPVLKISLTIFLGGVITFLTAVFATSFTAVKDTVKLEKKLKKTKIKNIMA